MKASILLPVSVTAHSLTPYDFQDAATTCLEKDRTPKKRDICQLCRILLGGDRVGMVGYAPLPPLCRIYMSGSPC